MGRATISAVRIVRFVCGFSRSGADEHLNGLKIAEILGVLVIAAAARMSMHIGGIVVDMRKRLGHGFIAAQVGAHGSDRVENRPSLSYARGRSHLSSKRMQMGDDISLRRGG